MPLSVIRVSVHFFVFTFLIVFNHFLMVCNGIGYLAFSHSIESCDDIFIFTFAGFSKISTPNLPVTVDLNCGFSQQ